MPSRFPVSRLVAAFTFTSAVACVYFQAAAASSLMAQRLLPPLPIEPGASAHEGHSNGRRAARNPQSLRSNNPFDWRIDVNPKPDAASATRSVGNQDLVHVHPLLAQVCTQVSVTLVTESTDPRESISVLRRPEDPTPIERRVGDHIGDYEVAYIGFNRTRASPAVWLVNSTGLCQTLLFGPEPETNSAVPNPDPSSTRSPKKAKSRGTPPSESPLPPDIAQRITKLDDSHVAVQRGVVDRVLADPSMFMGAARIVPARGSATQTSVIRLFGVREGSLLGALNLKNGDVLTRVNGFDLGSPEQALNAYAHLRRAEELSVEVLREGKPVILRVSIE